jgi:pSer/pThr/pTyr-binding forkhead associated (FHA) protein
MSAQVILTITGKTQCVLGRSQSCDVQVPAADYTVSRRHCLLDIDAPVVRVQDLGSLNGTYINEELIGRRDKRLDAAEAAEVPHTSYTVADGDELRVGDLVFRVQIVPESMAPEWGTKKGSSTCLVGI